MAIDLDKIKFGSAVRRLRNSMKISQMELAHRSGLHRTYVTDVERGARNLSLESISKLASALEVSMTTLFAQAYGDPARPWSLAPEILLVENNSDDSASTLEFFQNTRLFNRVLAVTNGQEALDYLRCKGAFHNRPDRLPELIMVSLDLPGDDGIGLVRQLKGEEKWLKVPVVILTKQEPDPRKEECRELGVEVYLRKPFKSQELFSVFARLNLTWTLMKQS